MKTLYFILGILGIMASFIMFIIVVANKYLDGGTKIAFVFVELIDFVSSAAFISISLLMEKSDEFETRIKKLEDYIYNSEEYISRVSQLISEKDKLQSNEKTVDEEMTSKRIGLQLLKEKNYSGAVVYLKKAVDEGDISACVHLGNCYMIGCGIAKDKEAAVELFEKASDAGIVNGTYYLGMAYLHGDGVKKNKEKARELILKASEQGSKKAKEYLEKYRI